MAKNKKNTTNYKKRKKFKIETPMIIIGIILLALFVFSYITFGIELTIVLIAGILFILGMARLLDRIKSKPKQRKIFKIFVIIFFIIAIAISILVTAFIIMVVKEAPNFDISKLNKREASILYDINGEEYARLGSELRENVTYDDLPEIFIDALIATEDSRFFQHNGFDAPRFIKASIGQILGNENAGGASTLSMQLVKNTYTSFETKGLDGIIRKFTDIYLAVFKLERNFTKEEIIEYYVNNYDLGNNAWGVEQASQTYFGKSVRDLNLSEAALLVGLFNAPSANNPFTNPYNAYVRRSQVLKLMVTHGYITQEEADMANSISISSLVTKQTKTLEYQGYIDTVIEELEDKHGINPYTTSVLVYTNMDRKKQAGIDEIMNGNTKYKWINDVVESGVAVIDVDTGKVVAIGAGRNKTTPRSWNFAVQETNQIGSTAKPIFDYGPAIEYLNWSTYEQIKDEPWTYSNGQNINNSDRKFMGTISMRTALAQSRNIPALKAFQAVQEQVGNKKIYEFVTNLGLTPDTQNGTLYESSSLGSIDGVNVLQMAAAYAAFANGGTYIEPLTVNKIIFRENNDVKTIKPEQTKAMSEATAFMISDMLVTAVQDGLSSGAKMNGVNLAAKTGTTSFDNATKKKYNMSSDAINDAWIVGYDPEYAVAMWYGYRYTSSESYLKQVSAVVERGKLYRAIGSVVFEKNSGKKFEMPSTVIEKCVEKGSNPPSLPSAGTPEDQITCEYFVKGKEPTEVSTKYDKLQTVSNLKVSYDENTMKITISWSKLNVPTENESFGQFGYNVYYGDVLLDFTTENTYTIEANANISGVYKVVTTFENYAGNQSDPATYNFVYTDPNAADTSVYNLNLLGNSPVTITSTESYTDLDIPVDLLRDGVSINSEVNIKSILTTTIKDPSGNTITSISGSSEAPLATGTYTITYTVKYKDKTYTRTRQVTVQ